jgi:hypothetical protein
MTTSDMTSSGTTSPGTTSPGTTGETPATRPADPRRFRTKADAFYVRHDDGVWLGNNNGSFTVRGKDAYQLVSALFASLDGERTLDEICGALPEAARRSVLHLVETLARRGFLKEVRHPREPVPSWMRERFAAHLAFLDHHADQPVTRMMRVRSRLVVCAGEGTALLGLLDALHECGVARVAVVTGRADEPAVTRLVTEIQAADPQCAWQVHVPGDVVDFAALAGRPDMAEAHAVLLARDTDDDGDDAQDGAAAPGSLAAAQQALRARGHAVGVLGRCGDLVVAVPPTVAPTWCWGCVRRCVAGRAVGDTSGLEPAVAPAALGALHVVQHTFARLAEVEIDGAGQVTSVEPVAPVVRTHTGRRHPLCPHHGAPARPAAAPARREDERVRPDVPASQDPAELVAISDRIVATTGTWTDQVTGPLLALGEGGLDQLPLSASSCLVADPAGTAAHPVTRRFVCHGLSPREARNQVVLYALEWLGTRVAELTGVLPPGHVLGAGWSRAEALYRAQVNAVLAAPAGIPAWSAPGDEPRTPVRAFLADALETAGRPWTRLAVLPLPTGFTRAFVRTADGELACGAGVDREHALDDALLTALARTQDADALGTRLAPPADTWAEALAQVGKREGTDVSGLLPFLGDHAHLVAFASPEAAR